MVRNPTSDIPPLATGDILPKLDLGRGQVPQLRSRNSRSESSQDKSMRDVVPQHRRLVLPNGGTTPTRKGIPTSREELQEAKRLHLALVVPDIKLFGRLKNSVYILQPTPRNQEILVHVLLQRKEQSQSETVFAFALTQLGLIEPSVAQLQYPEELELGWSDSTAPINEEHDGTSSSNQTTK